MSDGAQPLDAPWTLDGSMGESDGQNIWELLFNQSLVLPSAAMRMETEMLSTWDGHQVESPGFSRNETEELLEQKKLTNESEGW